MSSCQMPFNYDGAIFYRKDFDAKKLLLYWLRHDGASKSDILKIKGLSNDKMLSADERAVIDSVFETEDANTLAELEDDITTYLADELVSECKMDGKEYFVRRFDSSEAAAFQGEHFFDDDIVDCFFIALPSVFPWRTQEYNGPKNPKEAARYIKERIGFLTKNDIDWTKRLGELTGIYSD